MEQKNNDERLESINIEANLNTFRKLHSKYRALFYAMAVLWILEQILTASKAPLSLAKGVPYLEAVVIAIGVVSYFFEEKEVIK